MRLLSLSLSAFMAKQTNIHCVLVSALLFKDTVFHIQQTKRTQQYAFSSLKPSSSHQLWNNFIFFGFCEFRNRNFMNKTITIDLDFD